MGMHWRRLIAGVLAALALTGSAGACTAALPQRFESALGSYYREADYWVEWIGPLKEDSAARFCRKLQQLQGGALSEVSAFYWAIAPDKGVYTEPATTDYAAAYDYLEKNLAGMKGIDLAPALTLADYYRTDRHWRQEKLGPVISALGEAMNFSTEDSFTVEQGSDFIGAYGPYLPSWTRAEPFYWLNSEMLEQVTVENMQRPDQTKIYWEPALESSNRYDFFLGGASPLITLKNPKAPANRKLILFGDSFASSLAPLLCESYSEITVVDLRYLGSSVLEEYLDAAGKEVLFLYSVWVVNNSAMLR